VSSSGITRLSTTIIGKGGGGKVRAYAVAFGKHPGWDDHIDEIGLETDLLVRLKRVLYTEGLAGNIDSGAWDKLEEAKRLPGYDHAFYWRTPEGWLIGRMWSSVDGKGRTKYPMIVAGMLSGVSLRTAMEQIAPRLETLKSQCLAAKDKVAVRMAVEACKTGLDETAALLAGNPSNTTTLGGDSDLIRRLISHADLNADGTEQLGLRRVLYEMHRELGAFRPGHRSTSAGTGLGPQHIRVPRCLTEPGQAVQAWVSVMRTQVVGNAPILVIEAIGQSFIDMVVGEPSPATLYCVRASGEGLHPTSLVPYTIHADFMREADGVIRAWVEGKDPSPTPSTKARPAPVRPAGDSASGSSERSIPLSLIIGGAFVLIGIVVVVLIMMAPSQVAKAKAQENTPEPEPAPTKATEAPAPVPVSAATPAFKPGDPRGSWNFESSRTSLEAALNAFDASVKDRATVTGTPPPATSPAAALRAELAKAVRNAADARTTPFTPANTDMINSSISMVDRELAKVADGLKTLEQESNQALKEYLASAAAKSPVQSAAASATWSNRVKAIDPSLGWKAASDQVKQLASLLEQAQKQAGDLSPLPTLEPIPGVEIGALTEAASARRQQASDQIAAAAAANNTEAAAASRQDWALWQSDLTESCTLARNLVKALTDGDPAAARVSHKALIGSQGFTSSKAPFARLVQAAAAVDAASTESASALVAHLANWDKQPLSTAGVVAAVQAFASNAPRTAEELAAFKAAAAKLSGTGPVPAAVASAWPQVIDASIKPVLGDPARLAVVLEQAQGLSSPVITAAAYNLQLAALKKSASQSAKDTKGLLTAVQAFAASQAQERAAGQWPAAAAFAEALVGGAQRAAKAAGGNVSSAGPASKGWKSQVSEGGTAIFTLERGDVPVTIAFRRVDAGGGEVSWVSTGEVTVGAFIEVAAATSKFDDLSNAMAKTVVGGKDMRVGPRTWTWGKAPTGGGQAMLIAKGGSKDLSLGWLTGVTDLGGKAYYAPDLASAPAAPVASSPMQYVSPQAAVLWASLVGCRLPTVAEWRAASQAGEAGTPNRRDATWVTQFKQVQLLNAGGAATQWPNAGIFYPTSAPRPSAPQDAAAAVELDDKVLWFSPINAGAEKFEHLVGNVAEFVTESVVTDGTSDLAAIEKQLKRGEGVRVVGASALSPASVDPAVPLGMVWTAAKEGYSDVGFRLAFTAAPAPVQESDPSSDLVRLVQEAKYIDQP
jgi:hypothetical protein